MNHTLTNPHNIDAKIQELQTWLYEGLVNEWGLLEVNPEDVKLDGYGRIYKNERNGKVIPEVYDTSKKGYVETLYNNRSCFFFIDDDNHPCDDQDHEFTTNVKIVFMLKLDDLKTATERVDADVKRDITVLLAEKDYHFRMDGYIKGIDEVFRGFDTDKIKHNDMQPLHVCAFETSWSYSVI